MSLEPESDEEEDEEPSYFGKRNADGLPHGRGTLKWIKSGNRFEGRFVDGSREGRGCFYFSDGSVLSGSYAGDQLDGETVYTHSDGSYLMAEYSNGEMEGPFCEHGPDGRLTATGLHRDGSRSGFLQTFDDFGGSVIGFVDTGGRLTGEEIAYVYPDKTTALIGQFEDGQLVEARYAKLEYSVGDIKVSELTKLPAFSYRSDFPEIVHFDLSTRDSLSTQPLVCDAYEQDRVCVKKSLIENAGEGLFTRVDLKEDEVASFYNGLRLSHDEVDSRDWSLNDNTISLDEETVIDVPLELATTDKYRASLGHKANHSSSPNCKYDLFHHPR